MNLKWKHYWKFFLLLVFIYSVFVMSFSTVAYFMCKGFHASRKDSNVTFSDQDMLIITIGNGFVCFSGAFLLVHAIIQVIRCQVKEAQRD